MAKELQSGPALEVIDKGACSAEHPAPLLFVHGAWHTAWCRHRFVDFFADEGYRALAVSRRGHGGSLSPKSVRGCSLADYVDDVRSVADSLQSTPVLIGHSMGGFVVQKYLETAEAPAGVLIASAPPQGARRFANTPAIARKLFFSAATPASDVQRYAAMLGNESQRVALDTARRHAMAPQRVTTPLLVLGAALDGCITRAEVHDTARAYGTDAEIFDGIGHNMMLEPGWAAVAGRIRSWLAARGL